MVNIGKDRVDTRKGQGARVSSIISLRQDYFLAGKEAGVCAQDGQDGPQRKSDLQFITVYYTFVRSRKRVYYTGREV